MIVHSHEPIVLVGAGDVSAEDIAVVHAFGSKVVAADGGAAHCVAAGIAPDAVIGDLDSLPEAVLHELPADRLHHIAEQDTTDFDKCLRSIDAPLVLAVGFAGPRLDHTLAVFNTLASHPDKRVVVLGASDLVFHAPPRLSLDLPVGTRFSLFPLVCLRGGSEGLRWPIDSVAFSPVGRIGTSNMTTGPVLLQMNGAGMLVITPREALEPVIAALHG